jgi:hypothetical protein
MDSGGATTSTLLRQGGTRYLEHVIYELELSTGNQVVHVLRLNVALVRDPVDDLAAHARFD